jgi:hypothetical protein
MNFIPHENDIIYDAVRYYQMNKVTLDTKLYWDCDIILRKLFPKVKINGVEPAYRSDI